jgi:nicotinic acid mononucleotide adenylyltransferase
MKREVTHWRFLLENKLEKEKLQDSLSTKTLFYALHDRMLEHDFTCHGLVLCYKEVAKDLFSVELKDDFLAFAYQYTLSKSFPDAVTEDFSSYPVQVYEVYLRLLSVWNEFQNTSEDQSFMSIYPMSLLDEKDIRALDDPSEYQVFKEAFEAQHIYSMMKLNYEVTGHSTIEHILGVHHLALYISRQLLNSGVPVDLGRVSGAAAGHDIGKFGCRPEEKNKIAYYHYYYTYNWFSELDINYIKNVAVYHSTWDLEIESLSIESLILIYSDFCVKRSKNKPGLFKMKFLTVDEAFQVILDKLDNVDETKHKRYERVYQKLKNFASYMMSLGVDLTVANYVGEPLNNLKKELLVPPISQLSHGMSVVNNLKYVAIDKSVRLMNRLRTAASLNGIIQEALSEKDTLLFRRYIFVFEEYSKYLTPNQKLITMSFLKSYIMHAEEDIRKETSGLIGTLLASYDENYTKELPERANLHYTVETKFNKLKEFLNEFLLTDMRLTPVKRERQVTSYFELIKSLYNQVDDDFKDLVTDLLLTFYVEALDVYGTRFLLESISLMPIERLGSAQLHTIVEFAISHLNEPLELRLIVVSQINHLLHSVKHENIEEILAKYRVTLLDYLNQPKDISEKTLCKAIDRVFQRDCIIDSESYSSEMFLSNLKSATPKISKEVQIDLLYHRCLKLSGDERFYTAMHFCNILKVSAYESVRNMAGDYLVSLFDTLKSQHQNDIIIELIRALEIEGYGFTKYIPNYLGQLIPLLQEKEYLEILADIKYKISNAGVYVRVLLIYTLAAMIKKWLEINQYDRITELVGYLFKGFYSDNHLVTQLAFNVLSKEIIGNSAMALELRFELFKKIYKKLNCFVSDEHQLNALDILNYSVGMHYMYHFITDYEYFIGQMAFELPSDIAFYSGTFDPFSLGQKSAVLEALEQGMEVYISISEFQWKRRTQPSLMRKQIVEMSIADLLNVYTFPQDQPINLRVGDDLEKLQAMFEGKNIYIVMGEEALLNDALYGNTIHSIYDFNHLIVNREMIDYTKHEQAELTDRVESIRGLVKYATLEKKYDMIDVTQIRRNIDNNWDAFDVIDDLATQYILKNNLYKNEPQYKSTVPISPVRIEHNKLKDFEGLEKLCQKFSLDYEHILHLAKGTYAGDLDKDLILDREILTIINEIDNEVMAYSIYSKASPKNLFNEIRSLEILEEISSNKYDKILIVDYLGMKVNNEIHALDQIIVTETLVREISNGYQFAVIKCSEVGDFSEDIHGVILRSGFVERICTYSKKRVYSVDMTEPIVLNLDGTTRMKADFRSNTAIRDTIKFVRSDLQQSIVNLYPGCLVLSFDRSMLYNHLIRKITKRNNVALEKGQTGQLICVPYGDIFKRWLLPNTITKAFHTERYYTPELTQYEVKSYPGYLSIEHQTKVLKAYKRPIILVDDIIDKGNRLTAFEKHLRNEAIEIDQTIVGIMSKRGKDQFSEKGISMDSAYFIPKIKVWFNEADLYPFIGGDSVEREGRDIENLLMSANMMLPFSYPKYIKNAEQSKLYDLSFVCLENALTIMKEIESLYLELFKKNLSLEHLKEVMIIPRIPDIGASVHYDMHERPSVFLENEMERLKKMKYAFYE